MKVFYKVQDNSGMVMRIIKKEFMSRLPRGYREVTSIQQAQLILMDLWGRGQLNEMKRYLDQKKKVIAILHPPFANNPAETNEILRRCEGVISFHTPHKHNDPFGINRGGVKYIYTPWGVKQCYLDLYSGGSRKYKVMTTGHIARSESIDIIYNLCKKHKWKMLHIGGHLEKKIDIKADFVTWKENISDSEMVESYRSCEFINGLRVWDGFELPAVEGYMQGATPLVYEYNIWLESISRVIPGHGLAKDIDETTKHVEEAILNGPLNHSVQQIRSNVHGKFDWNVIIRNIWKQLGM